MAGFTRTVHPQANFEWRKLAELAPDVIITPNVPEAEQQAAEVMGLAFIDPDGETHIYVMTDEGKGNLIRKLTGGVVLP
jgi:hypothetical protein